MEKNLHKILVIGPVGCGKSTFCNYILGSKICKENDGPYEETREFNVYLSEKKKNNDIIMIDTSCFSDLDGEDQRIIDEIKKEIKTKCYKGIKSIIIMFNFQANRIGIETKKLLLIYSKLFPSPDFWHHVGVVFSHSYENFPELAFQEMKKEKLKYFISRIEEVIKEIIDCNNKIGIKMEMPNTIQIFFTDCNEIIPGNRTDKEVDNLINWTRGLNYLDIDKNDLEGQVFVNYKIKERKEDIIEAKEEREDDKTKKVTMEHYKRYRIVDSFDKVIENIEPNPYKKEIFYFITEEWEEMEKKGEYFVYENDKKTFYEILIKKRLRRTNKYDKNKNHLEQGLADVVDVIEMKRLRCPLD